MIRHVVCLVAFLLPLLVAFRARAFGPPELAVAVDTDTCVVGDNVRLVLRASSNEEMPDNPHPGPTPGFVVRDASVSPFRMTMNLNGMRRNDNQLTATWVLQAQRTGTFTIGPPSVTLGGKRYTASRSITVKVVAGTGARRPPVDPLDVPIPDEIDTSGTDPKLALAEPRGNDAFLHAVVDKTNAVIGEQLTLTVYLYADPRSHAIMTDEKDVAAPDFMSRPLDTDKDPAREANVGGMRWRARVFRKYAMVPLKAGDLEIGAMSISLAPDRRGGETRRDTETFSIHVTEPPAAGRPPGYVLGDVGKFSLTAEVEPRDLEKDGAVAVNARLSGTGNLPLKLSTPLRGGIEWLDPQVQDIPAAKTPDKNLARTFSFVVRVHKEGSVDLGDLTLPYWDPDLGRYQVARAALGAVRVKAGGAKTWTVASAPEQLAGMPPPRMELAGRKGTSYLVDSPMFLVGIGAPPLAYGFAVGVRAAVRRWKKRRDDRAASPATELKARLAAARAALGGTDASALDAAVVRAIEAAAVARLGVNVRGAMSDEVAERLAERGAAREVAVEIQEILRGCEDARFSPEGAHLTEARARWERARRAIEGLGGAP